MLEDNKYSKKIKEFRERYRITFTLIGVVGIILIWRGVWTIVDTLPYVNNPFLSLLIGFIFVAVSGIFFRLI